MPGGLRSTPRPTTARSPRAHRRRRSTGSSRCRARRPTRSSARRHRGSRAVVAHDRVPGHVVALPPPHHARLVEPPVQHRQVVVDQPPEAQLHGWTLKQRFAPVRQLARLHECGDSQLLSSVCVRVVDEHRDADQTGGHTLERAANGASLSPCLDPVVHQQERVAGGDRVTPRPHRDVEAPPVGCGRRLLERAGMDAARLPRAPARRPAPWRRGL